MTGLGRGLDALIDTTHVDTNGGSSISEVELNKIVANPDQPRRNFDEDALAELADSIREHGVISPITLRKNDDGTYMIIAGERRFRASKMAGLNSIPAYIRTAKDEQVMEWALIENIQREDLDAIEIALAYQRLMDEYQLTQERMSERVGKKRATVANYLRLLKLPAQVQMSLQKKELDMGHARALLSLESPTQQIKLFKDIIKNGYSVRKVEELVKRIKNEEQMDNDQSNIQKNPLSEKLGTLSKQLSGVLATKVQMTCTSKGKGKISIPFANESELERILLMFDKLKG